VTIDQNGVGELMEWSVEKGRQILADSGIALTTATTMADAAEKAIRIHLQEMISTITPIAEQNSDWFDAE